jgi:uncharacterized protein
MAPADLHIPPLEHLIIQGTPFCNLDCRYCYLDGRNNRAQISEDVIDVLAIRLRDYPYLGKKLRISWHAGEPLVLGARKFGHFCARLRRELEGHTDVSFSVQTNATLVSPDWIAALQSHAVSVGISLDGPREMHDAYRRDRSSRGTFDQTIAGFRLLRESGMSPAILCVLHDKSIDKPEELFDFFEDLEVETICFNVETDSGFRLSSVASIPNSNAVARDFFARYFELVISRRSRQWVRELDSAVRAFGARFVARRQQVALPGAIMSVSFDGYASTFSPELLTWPGLAGKFRFLDLRKNDLAEIFDQDAFKRVKEEVDAGCAACERDCSYFRYCGGGSPAAKLAELGRFDGTSTSYCRTGTQAPVDALLMLLEKVPGADVAHRAMESVAGRGEALSPVPFN